MVILFICIYVFLPQHLSISKATLINCTPDAANRYLSNTNNWPHWWMHNTASGNTSVNKNSFIYKNDTFRIKKISQSSIELTSSNGSVVTNSILHVLPVSFDTVSIRWEGFIELGLNPVKRVRQYLQSTLVKNDMGAILDRLNDFLSKKENVYGLTIEKSSTIDTSLVATKTILSVYPSTAQRYAGINLIQDYIKKGGAQQTGFPMVNVTKSKSDSFQLMVAIPTNKEFKPSGKMLYRKMVQGNFLVTEVKGGDYTINAAIATCELYIRDYKKVSMAIPFQSLVTDRSQEPDTAKWVTKIYYPINY
ncbi:MAG: hypothetical protein ACR2KZ_08410 [Segetibacter sp.]